MAISANIIFSQPGNTGAAGVSLIGVASSTVTCTNSNDTGVVSWEWDLLDIPRGSALTLGTLGTGSFTQFVPDVGGCYRVKLIVRDSSGVVVTQIRNFAVPLGSLSWIVPSFKSGSDELNFSNNTRGWATYLEKIIDDLVAIAGGITLAGDASGLSSATVVGKINGATAPSSPASGDVGKVIGVTAAGAYGLVSISGGSSAGTVIDLFANRPAGSTGQLFVATDCFYRGYFDGANWRPYFNMGALGTKPPSAASFTAQSATQGGITATLTNDKDALLLDLPVGSTITGTSEDTRAWSFPAPATPYSITVAIRQEATLDKTGGQTIAGVGWRYSGNGDMVNCCVINGGGGKLLSLRKLSSSTVFSSTYLDGGVLQEDGGVAWLKIKDDGTNRLTYASSDGTTWQLLHSIARTDFLVTAPDQVIITVGQRGGASGRARIMSWVQGT